MLVAVSSQRNLERQKAELSPCTSASRWKESAADGPAACRLHGVRKYLVSSLSHLVHARKFQWATCELQTWQVSPYSSIYTVAVFQSDLLTNRSSTLPLWHCNQQCTKQEQRPKFWFLGWLLLRFCQWQKTTNRNWDAYDAIKVIWFKNVSKTDRNFSITTIPDQ